MQTAWETLHTRINSQKISVDERTMGSRDLVKEVTQMDLNAQNAPNITGGTGLHFQKMSNLCVYFATISVVRHEMKKIIGNSTSTAVNIDSEKFSLKIHQVRHQIFTENTSSPTSIPIPAGKSIDELFIEKEFWLLDRFVVRYESRYEVDTFQNALSFERMLSVLLGCVSPRALSGLVKTLNIHLKLKYGILPQK